MHWFVIQLAVVFALFFVSTVAAWYEGSAVLYDPWEWKYSTPFSHVVYGNVEQASQITWLDHFVYAAKFQPLFPVLMTVSALYVLFLIGCRLLKTHRIRAAYYFTALGLLSFIISFMLLDALTIGGSIFFYVLLASGGMCFLFLYELFIRREGGSMLT
ncbi:protein of unknown function [Alteribacillus persepolensis]|uniref:DUF4306 domain-containing protein n=1 Tax=Alteribacillus persepolensis TaxID=568899 RepID=A0A1G8ATK9_9BACI|nr:YjdJ family protein [Alteribacillus persepolensis]SDH24257.1 protein of unknown function [Alteribacillus persepolensis]